MVTAGTGLQELTFWSLEKYRHLEFDETLHFCLDVDWYCRIGRGARIALSPRRIGCFRWHPQSKTAQLQEVARQEIEIITRHQRSLGTFEHAYEEVRASALRAMPLLVAKRMLLGAGEFCYRHPS